MDATARLVSLQVRNASEVQFARACSCIGQRALWGSGPLSFRYRQCISDVQARVGGRRPEHFRTKGLDAAFTPWRLSSVTARYGGMFVHCGTVRVVRGRQFGSEDAYAGRVGYVVNRDECNLVICSASLAAGSCGTSRRWCGSNVSRGPRVGQTQRKRLTQPLRW